MKVLHLCLANFYIDNYSYQENMLPKYHQKLGCDVEIIASLQSFDENGKLTLLPEAGSYLNEHGIKVTRLAYLDQPYSQRFRRYKGTYAAVAEADPDIIFIHGCQFRDIKLVAKYVDRHPEVKVYVDSHADFSNSARNWRAKHILHKIVWRNSAHIIEPYAEKFYGVLPARVDFLIDVYNLPAEKVELLVMGADDDRVAEAQSDAVRADVRARHGVAEDDFLIVTGGKIDLAKQQMLTLMEVVRDLPQERVKLLVFGSIIPEMQAEVERLVAGNKVQYIGWLQADETYDYFAAADLVIFPGRHSVFWEQVVAQGVPLVVREWPGTTHVDIGGNCLFLEEDSPAELRRVVTGLIENPFLYREMLENAQSDARKQFLYSEIAAQSIEAGVKGVT